MWYAVAHLEGLAVSLEQDPLRLFGLSFGISSVAGLAALLRSRQKLTTRYILSACLNSGCFGAGVAMIWYEWYGGAQYPWFMLGVSLLAGLGGTSLMDFVFETVREVLRAYAQQRLLPPRKQSDEDSAT